MKLKILLVCVFFIFILVVGIKIGYSEKYSKKLIAEIPEANIKLYSTKEENGMYKDFVLEVDNREKFFNWENTTSLTWSPQLVLSDLNGDDEKELIVILTHGHGTGILIQEIHIINTSDFTEIAVDNPLDIIDKEVETRIIEDEEEMLIEVTIGDKTTITKLEKTYTSVWFNDVFFGNIIYFDVTDNELKVHVTGQISPAGSIGKVIIDYEFKDNRFKMKTIRFELYELYKELSQ